MLEYSLYTCQIDSLTMNTGFIYMTSPLSNGTFLYIVGFSNRGVDTPRDAGLNFRYLQDSISFIH